MRRSPAFTIFVMIFSFFAVVVPQLSISAAANASFTQFTPISGSGCVFGIGVYSIQFDATIDDGGGQDYVSVVLKDATGIYGDVDFFSGSVGLNGLPFSDPTGFNSAPAARPFTLELYDITDPTGIIADTPQGLSHTLSGTLLSTYTFDPVPDVPACASLPLQLPAEPDAPPAEPADFCLNPLPDGSVVGEAPLGAQIYWEPAEGSASLGNTLNPGTYWVVGVDESGAFSKIWLTCNSQFWVPSNALQPNYAAPWNGQPLPTRVVS